MGKNFLQVDPSKPVPPSVQAALNVMSEGVLLLDNRQRIILANDAFAESVGASAAKLLGRVISALPWQKPGGEDESYRYPWTQALQEVQECRGVPVDLRLASNDVRHLIASVAPIVDDGAKVTGAFATFTNILDVEKRKAELRHALDMAAKAQEEVVRQNAELQVLAMRDPLTGCLNRRAFVEDAEIAWGAAKRYQYELGFLVVDIDHFKWVNDRHGHAVGDQILRKLTAALQQCVRQSDVVCRYGGDEFYVLLLHTDMAGAMAAAEKVKRGAELQMKELAVTVSIGVSSTELGASGLHDVLDEADKALYAAKEAGRDAVVGWDQMAGKDAVKRPPVLKENPSIDDPGSMHIPLAVVNALMATLEYRDPSTAKHSRHVAELCVRTAVSLMPPSDCFVLEVAALLHDIGKLGVPDSILLKAGPLTDEEWAVMRRHSVLGAEIVASAFACQELADTVRYCHVWHGECQNEPGLPSGKRIPLRARILLLADAYSSMTSDRPYRKAMSPKEAIRELRRSSGTQFDPELVELFAERVVKEGADGAAHALICNESVLTVGRMAESLASSLKTQDTYALGCIAERLAVVAANEGMTRVAESAQKLRKAVNCRQELKRILQLTTDLLKHCSHLRTA